MKNIYTFNKVFFSYRSEQVLKNISITIKQNERVAILGANGSGKSTLLKLMAGLEYPSEGTISFKDHELSQSYFSKEEHEITFRKKVGFIFQDSDVQLFCQSVWDEVSFGPLQLGFSKEAVNKVTTDACKKLGILHLKERSPFTLSGGEKKKVALASVLSMKPKVWILDEPTSGLDPRTQSLLFDVLIDLHLKGATIIISTHDLLLLEELADRVILISEDHEIVADDSPKKILSNLKLLKRYNLVHDHMHIHNSKYHKHIHMHTTLNEYK